MDGMFGNFPENQAAFAAAIAALAERFAATASEHDRTGAIAHQNLRAMHQSGLIGLAVDQRFGGQGGSLRQMVQVIGGIAQGDPSTALIVSMQYLQIAAATASNRWPEEVLGMVSRAAVEEGALINALRVEPDLGTPARGGLPGTIARRTREGWRISGRKLYSTGSHALRWGVVWGRTDEEAARVGGFLVPMAAPGVSIEESWNQLGMRATGSHTVVLDDVLIPHEAAVDVRAPDAWGAPDATQLVWISVVIAAIYDGVARSARAWLIGFLHRRAPANAGGPLAGLPRFADLIGEIELLLMVNRRLIDGVVAAEERGEGTPAAEAGLLKTVLCENAIKAVELGLAAIGNPGLSRDNPLERHYRDVLCARIHTPQRDAAIAAAGRLALQSGNAAPGEIR